MRLSLRALLALAVVAASGCIDRTRVNASCTWSGDTTFPIDAQDPTHLQHLVADAQLAEELAIRYADAEHKRLFGYEGHGGLIDHGRLRERCMATLVNAIEQNHAVTPEQIDRARAQRSAVFDGAVLLTFVVPYALVAAAVWRLVCRHVPTGTRSAGVTLIATSCIAAAAGLLGLPLWGAVWEAARVGNGHISGFRAARSPWIQHFAALYTGGVVVFWLAALSCDRIMPKVDESSDVAGPEGIRLR